MKYDATGSWLGNIFTSKTGAWKSEPIIAAVILVAVVIYAFIGHTYFFNLDLQIALRGFSVVEFSNSVLYPENYQDNYPGGSSTIGKSSIVWIYPFLDDTFGVKPFTALHVIIFIEVLALALGAHVFMRTFLENSSYAALIILIILVLSSGARFISLARFGQPFIGQFYIFADVLGVFAFCAFYTKRYWLSLALLCVGFTVHPIMTAAVLPVLLGFALIDRARFQDRNIWLMGMAFVVFAAVWSAQILDFSGTSVERMPEAEWFKYSRLLNYHWYLSELHFLVIKIEVVILPFLSFLIIGLEALRRTQIHEQLKKQLLVAVAMIVAISAFGIAASELELHSMLAKLSPQRSSAVIAVLLLPFFVHRIVEDLRTGLLGIFLVALSILILTLTTHRQPYSVGLAFLYAAPGFLAFFRDRQRSILEWSVVGLVFAVAVIVVVHGLSSYARPLAAYMGPLDMFVVALAGFFLILFPDFFKMKTHFPNVQPAYLAWGLVAIFVLLGANWLGKYRVITEAQKAKGADLLAAQHWARDNTDNKALFMLEPCLAYGWRDFSNRSSWGSYHEFLKTGWLYNSNNAVLQEGLRRTKSLGIDLEKILKEHGQTVTTRSLALCKQSRLKYYDADYDWLKKMSKEYGIDYFIFFKKHLTGKVVIPPAYKNETLIIIEAPKT